MKRLACALSALALLGLVSGCRQEAGSTPAGSIRLATTTSLENSGLLSVLVEAFGKSTGIEVHVMPMGTGKALRTARDGNCDVVLVHAPEAEEEFVRAGWGINRRCVMYSDFIIVGPREDPAGVGKAPSAAEAMKNVAARKCPFVSRGDDSGTHKKEKWLWRRIGMQPAWRGYLSVGKGMGATLIMAGELKAYTLVDRGTFLRFRDRVGLEVLLEGDEDLRNPYSVIAVNPARHPGVRHAAATKFIDFLTSAQARRLIGDFDIHGQRPFHPWPRRDGASAPAPEETGP